MIVCVVTLVATVLLGGCHSGGLKETSVGRFLIFGNDKSVNFDYCLGPIPSVFN